MIKTIRVLKSFWHLSIVMSLILIPGSIYAENWPGFRGPGGQGISSETNLPVVWNDSAGIVWQTDIPGSGWSSPIVWDDHIFLTTVTDSGKSCHILALDRVSGEIIWNRKVMEQVPGHMHGKNSYASSTPVTDGQMIYAVFGDGSMVALNFEGQVIWKNREIRYFSEHGLGASPVLFNDLIIMPFDGSSSGPDIKLGWQIPWDEAVIVAFDKRSGDIRWQAKRGLSRIAHVTPAIMMVGDRPQLISGAGDVVQGFDPENGNRLWSVRNTGEGVVPSVVIGDGLVYTTSGWGDPAIRATRPGTADSAKVVWEQKLNVPKIPSFVYKKPYLYTLAEHGMIMCLDEATGEIVWNERISGKYWASPLLAGDKIYLLNEMAQTTVIEAGPEFRLISNNNLTGKCQASMAVAKGRILIRTDQQLYCIGSK